MSWIILELNADESNVQAAEDARLADLVRLRILDTPRDENFDLIVGSAAAVFDVPFAFISLTDRSRQWFKAAHGLVLSQTPRLHSFCSHAIVTPERVTIVRDARADARFAAGALVTNEPRIRFYAGAPLISARGFALGTLCIMDRHPRTLTRSDQVTLRNFAVTATRLIELGAPQHPFCGITGAVRATDAV